MLNVRLHNCSTTRCQSIDFLHVRSTSTASRPLVIRLFDTCQIPESAPLVVFGPSLFSNRSRPPQNCVKQTSLLGHTVVYSPMLIYGRQRHTEGLMQPMSTDDASSSHRSRAARIQVMHGSTCKRLTQSHAQFREEKEVKKVGSFHWTKSLPAT